MRIVFAGTPEVALPALDAIAGSAHELVGVVTRPDAPSGRGRKLVASPVAHRAQELGVPVLKPAHPREPGFQVELKALEPACCPVVAYGAMLPESTLDIPPHGWVNLHFSCLPAWRGAAPVQHAIWAGDEVSGATTFRIVKELDAGPTYGVMTERIRPTDTAGDLLARLADGGAGLLVATLDGLADGTLEARPQQPEGVSFAPKILVDDARIDWTEPAIGVDRKIRACTPAPGAWTTLSSVSETTLSSVSETTLGGERIKVGPVTVAADHEPLAPGVLDVTKNAVFVGTATTPVRLGEVKAHGRKQLDAADWARGVTFAPGARFGD
jgi:methionyl-tRNA formyltransferase